MDLDNKKNNTSNKSKFVNEPYVMEVVTSNTRIKSTNRKLFLGIFLILLLLVSSFFWYKMSHKKISIVDAPLRPTAAENNEPESTTAEAETESLNALSSSDELSAIEADLKSTNLDSLTSDLNQIDAVLDSSSH